MYSGRDKIQHPLPKKGSKTAFHPQRESMMQGFLRRSQDKSPTKKDGAAEAKLTTIGLVMIRIKEAVNVKTTGKYRSIYCQLTCGTQKVFSRVMAPRGVVGAQSHSGSNGASGGGSSPSGGGAVGSGGSNQGNGEEATIVFDETLILMVEQRAMELQVVVFQPHSLDVDKLIGHEVVRLSDCKEFETNEFCVKLTKPKDGKIFFEAKYFSMLTDEEIKEYGEYLYVLSEETFLDLFKKDRLGFTLTESELKDYALFARNRKNPLLRTFSKKKWQHWKTAKELKQFARKGLPLSHRAEVWLTASRAKERKAENKGMYWTLLDVHKDEVSPHVVQIQKDLERTFPGHRTYLDKRGLAPLQRVLTAYAWKNSSIGYCQSMNFITGFLLLFMDEESAFWLLSAIVEELVPDYYAPVMIGAKADQIVFCQLVEKKLPAVHAHFTKLNVQYYQATIQWFLSLFIDQLPSETTLRVLDAFFCEGSMVLLRVGLAVLKMRERQILATTDFESCWVLLKKITRGIYEADALMKLAFGELGSFKELKIATKRGHAYRQIEDKGSISTFQGFKKTFKAENGRSLRKLRLALSDHFESPFSFKLDLAILTEHLLKLNISLNPQDIKSLFKVLDSESKGAIDFYELMCALSLLFNGVPVEKLFVCFQMFDTDDDGKLDARELQHFVSIHYKWVRRAIKGNTEWQVDAVVQHETDLLWKKVRAYLEEKGGKLDFVEFRFKVASELEALEEWLRSEPREVTPPRRTAAQILEEHRHEEREKGRGKENGGSIPRLAVFDENGKGKEKLWKEKEKEKEEDAGIGARRSDSEGRARVNNMVSSLNLDLEDTRVMCAEPDGLKRRSASSDSLHDLMFKNTNKVLREKSPRDKKAKAKKVKSIKTRWSAKKTRRYKTFDFKEKGEKETGGDSDSEHPDAWRKGRPGNNGNEKEGGLSANDVTQSDD